MVRFGSVLYLGRVVNIPEELLALLLRTGAWQQIYGLGGQDGFIVQCRAIKTSGRLGERRVAGP
jgi:hypothetical protein